MAETLTFGISGFSLKSSWTNKGGRVYTTPTTAKATKTVAVSGIPDGATIDSVVLHVTCGSSMGGANVLTVNGKSLRANRANTVDFASTVTANGSYSFLFKFKENGVDSLSDGTHYGSMSFSGISLVITYTPAAEPEPEPEPEPEELYDYPDSHNISFYAPDDEDFTSNGLGILTPSRCIVTEEAGGQYELEMELPAEGDSWQLLECESIIKAPVPVITIEAFEMAGAEYWKIKSNRGSVAVKSKIPTVTRVASSSGYSSWSASTPYATGAKVSYNGNAWQYTGPNLTNYYADVGVRPSVFTSAPGSASYWKNITSYSTKTNSGKTLATLGRNEVFTVIDKLKNNTWLRVKTSGGVTGYIEASNAEYFSNEGAHVESREIRQQCFRVYRIEKDSETRTVRVNARHLSYDFAKTYLAKCEAKTVTVPTAISLIEEAELEEDNRHIYTDISETTVDLDCSWENGVTALLNPDAGVVAQLQAKLIRDNEDFFVLADAHTDRGFRIDYGNNLKSVQWTVDTSSMVTRVVPYCKNSANEDMILPELYVESEKIEDYPVVYTETMSVNCKEGSKGTIDGTEIAKLTKEQCYTIMREEAKKRFDVDHADEPEVTIDIDMLMLGSTVEYAHLAPLEVLFMYDTVHISHPLLKLNIDAYMTGYEYDAILRRYNRITLTNARRRIDNNVAAFDIRDNSIRFEKLSSTAVDRLRS